MNDALSDLSPFFDQDGRLLSLPAKHRKKLLALWYLAGKLEDRRQYAEAELNALLDAWTCFHDPATLRRELYNKRLLNRTAELAWRISLMERFPAWRFDLNRLTCRNTHGDYFISQFLCEDGHLTAVIDWTAACVHPVVWELTRSFVYAAPCCADGSIDRSLLARYVHAYCRYGTLNGYDLEQLERLYLYQIAVCDYYGQYYASAASNRHSTRPACCARRSDDFSKASLLVSCCGSSGLFVGVRYGLGAFESPQSASLTASLPLLALRAISP